MDYEKEIGNIIKSMSGKYSTHEIFRDFVECNALAIQNSCCLFHDEIWEEREKQYLYTINKYDEKDRMKIAEMSAYLCMAYEKEIIDDVLGNIYMKSNLGNKHVGQFFTPFCVSKLTSHLTIPDNIDQNNVFRMNEPTCGSGGMMIAAASTLKKRGINYQRCMKVVAQDLDWTSVYMTYIQLSYLGIDAVIAQGDTLNEPFDGRRKKDRRVFRTPMNMGLLV